VSRYKFDRSREFIPGYKVGCGHWRSVAVQTVSEPEISQSAGFNLRADVRVLVHEPLQICLESRSKSKKCDKQLTHIVRVSVSFCYSGLKSFNLLLMLINIRSSCLSSHSCLILGSFFFCLSAPRIYPS